MARFVLDPCVFVVMGGTGDLMQRKLLPALYHLAAEDLLPKPFLVLGVARKRDLDDSGFRAQARQWLQTSGLAKDEKSSSWCDACLYFHSIGNGDAEQYRGLAARISQLEEEHKVPGNRAFYLALPPASFSITITGLGEARLNRGKGWSRVVIEKPFGHDLRSAQELNQLIHHYFDESQIFRIDHYLGKETVQNLLVFRFANPIFETLWNRDRIQSVQITVAESVGVEGRADYYDRSGVLRDMAQNHLTQLLATVAMEVPSAFRADAIRNEKLKVLDSIAPIQRGHAVLGQYIEGLADGSAVPAYRKEPKVAPNSQTATFAALRLDVANWRWHGVPFYLRTGKRLRRRVSEIAITFRCPPVLLFQPYDRCEVHSNVLLITIQPDEGFDLCFEVKVPGQGITLHKQSLRFRYGEVFSKIPEAYETLLLDFLAGDQTLFVRSDMVEASWRLYTLLLEDPPEAEPYASGTWGPTAADRLLAEDHNQWFTS